MGVVEQTWRLSERWSPHSIASGLLAVAPAVILLLTLTVRQVANDVRKRRTHGGAR